MINRDGGPNGSYEITIKKVQAGDAGTYSVVSSNNFGKAECSAKIGVKGIRIFFICITDNIGMILVINVSIMFTMHT